MSAWLLLTLGVTSLAAGIVARFRVRRPSPLAFPVMMVSWLVGELPLAHLALQLAAVIVLVFLGALEHPAGVIGLVSVAASWILLLQIRQIATTVRPSGMAVLAASLGTEHLDHLDPARRARLRTELESGLTRHPFRFDDTGVIIERDLAYGDHPRHVLDIYRPADTDGPLPVVLQIHGGAWVIGKKEEQGQPLVRRLARSGYVCVAINYRLAPRHRMPDQIVDVKRAIAWVRANIGAHGGDPSVIVLTGGSAGGHLASLAALTPGLADLQPGFEDADTSVAGCVPFYGPPDLVDRDAIRGRHASLDGFLTRFVMPGDRATMLDLWERMCPIAHIGDHAPPFLVVQGELDVLVWREEARAFVERLREASPNPVIYWEVPGAQHAFDTFNSIRSAAAVDVVETFVGWVAATARRTSPPREVTP